MNSLRRGLDIGGPLRGSLLGVFGTMVLVSLGAACGRQESASTEAVGGAGGAAESGGGGARPDYEALYECAEEAFSDVRALGGEGYDPEVGILGEPQEKYLVSTTLIYWRPELTDELYQMGGDVMGQLVSTPGTRFVTSGARSRSGEAKKTCTPSS
jgi:hypothetical protein